MTGGICGWGGACVVKGGVHDEGGMHGKGGGACMAKGGMRGMHAPLLRDTAGQCAGGTHPTGMHSCWYIDSLLYLALHQISLFQVGFECRSK